MLTELASRFVWADPLGATDPNARFAASSLEARPGKLIVDQATLLNGDRFHGLPVRGGHRQGHGQ